MNTPRHQPGAGRRTTVTVLAAIALLLGVVLLAVAGYTWWDTYTYVPPRGGDTALVGVGYVIAGVLGVPAVLGLLLTGAGLAVRNRRPAAALVAVTLGLAVVLFPAVLASMAYTSSF